ncbi:uncharacterized protein LOC125868684 [Solanum stenotomum]|uniref:uncharacterized protein LOC125868684 n=1 Tax=Solanum stenotomum TaxID=172797 RepID=UPI0020CFF0CD|nr:uncharacterized protein LOC125868684 [Solanum stenotomum]
MPPRRVVKGHPARRNIEEQELPNAPGVQPQGEVTNVEFREAIWMLRQVVTNQDSLGVYEYGLKFTQLYRYAPKIVKDMRSRMSLFVAGFSHLSSKEGKAAMLIGDMDISKVEKEKLSDREEFRNKKVKTGNESGQQKGEYNGQKSQNFKDRPALSQGSVAQGGNWAPTCIKCGRIHPDWAAPRGAISGTGGGANRLYAFITFDIYVLLDPGASKANVVVDALGRLSIGSIAHFEKDKKELVKEVHKLARLGVRLIDSTKG